MDGAITVHIINHTHWDREWFLTSVYTSRWIAGLIERLAELVDQNPDFHYFFDGQTLVIEDLLQVSPRASQLADRLIRQGNLATGPYYCQPDWRLASGEALVRNLLYGMRDVQAHGGAAPRTGWLVDTFGHISQAPQIHRLFGIDSVYIWRGAPRMEPYFLWQAPDGSRLFAIDLFGGYRNLYGVTHTPEIAARRLQTEVEKLAPYYPTGDIPLFDGYDLEDNPEDPVSFYREHMTDLPPGIDVREATPGGFAGFIREKIPAAPEIYGELISGKYGAVFPGTLSARTYLKVMARDCDRLLYQVCEPLAVLARLQGRPYVEARYETWSRALLQNAVHDCICGVSIDQVHEKMEFVYREVFEEISADLEQSLDYILDGFAPGRYAISTNPMPYEGWLEVKDERGGEQVNHVRTGGIGVWQAGESRPIRKPERAVESFTWQNAHYAASLAPDGRLQLGQATLGAMLVYEEQGDAYSGERGRLLGALQHAGPFVVEKESEDYCVVRLECAGVWEEIQVRATLRLTFDPSPVLRWQVTLDGRGTDYRVDLVFDTGIAGGKVFAGMPFDVVERPYADHDMLLRTLDPKLESILLGQRELEQTTTFPFQDFVAISGEARTAGVFARGLHAYEANEAGRVSITLTRAVEWLTRPNLAGRVGDAGPFFYVPDARSERAVTHELAVWISQSGWDALQVQALNAAYQNPPLLAEARQPDGTRRELLYFSESLPLSSLHIAGGLIVARLFNPANAVQPLALKGILEKHEKEVAEVPAKQIRSIELGEPAAETRPRPEGRARLLTPPGWRVGPNQGLPDEKIIQELYGKVDSLQGRLLEVEEKLARSEGKARYLLQHQVYVLQRELLEYRLSARLNEIKLAMNGELTREYLFEPDPEIERTGHELNKLRIKRRIYDYVAQAVSAP